MNPSVADEVLLATEHLPDGATLVVPAVSWEDYERLLEQLEIRPHLRVSYDRGRLEIVSPSGKHEKYARFFDDLVRAYADAHKLDLEKLGQTTWRRKADQKGAEADASYYVGNLDRSLGEGTAGPESYPPPDIVLEIDLSRSSAGKFPIYAALAVSEVWTYDGQEVRFYALSENQYFPVDASQFFPTLTGRMLAEAVADSTTRGQTAALAAFRKMIG